ncbi:hypothetical protein BDW42DRAFT_171073 [Aspergillus taichungensis]|uniref:BTB domain-containing protein n=1 Tax=Aspergillus taichungensis TaxID=482145 RepID=A0A2J5HTB9_9EURO|nr:hypothetical protein BDW42DRAFT_171073 [Aspergillus taichungensis]
MFRTNFMPPDAEVEHGGRYAPNVLLICNDGTSFQAHSYLLAEYSTYFQRCFEFHDGGPHRVRTNFSQRSIKFLLEFVYTGQIHFTEIRPPVEPVVHVRNGLYRYGQAPSTEEYSYDLLSFLVEVHNLALCYHVGELRDAVQRRITQVLANRTARLYFLWAILYTLEKAMDATIKAHAAKHIADMLFIYARNKNFGRFMWTQEWCTALRRMSARDAQMYFDLQLVMSHKRD